MAKASFRRILSLLCILTLLLGLLPLSVSAAEWHEHNFENNLTDSSGYFTLSGEMNSRTYTITYNDLTLTKAMKLSTDEDITFTAQEAGTLTMVVVRDKDDNPRCDGLSIKVDGSKITISDGVATKDLEPGKHSVGKGDAMNILYISYGSAAPAEPECDKHVAADNAQWKTTTPATCYSKGVKETTCEACGKPITEELEMLQHEYAQEGAGDEFFEVHPGAGGCTAAGYKLAKCVNNKTISSNNGVGCEAVNDQQITVPAAGHKFIEGNSGICSVCKLEATDANSPGTTHSHNWGTGGPDGDGWIIDKQPDECRTNGSKHRTCQTPGCGVTENDVIDKAAHQDNGSGVCSVCGAEMSEPLSKIGTAGGWFETIYAELTVAPGTISSVKYSGETDDGKPVAEHTLEGAELALVRAKDGGARIDIPGLAAGTYTLTVTAGGVVYGEEDITVMPYDRSGYAHWNYTEGVGAYNDDGTLKEGAIVLYVTEENKNTVELTYGNKTVAGIGNILNSAGQDNGIPGDGQCEKKDSKGKTIYGTANDNQGILADLAAADIPLVVRIIGRVRNVHPTPGAGGITGLTQYDSNNYGGTVGDNGGMARIQSAKNITIEGIGPDATIDGWGIHFICQTADYQNGFGKNFEVRNINFENVPEDCIGMEGQQSGTTITAPVERGWVHNCSFIGPHLSQYAESDKEGGDGACDFKRGQYFTMDYCYFEGYHKTNLIGSSDSSLQFHITWHHNWWKDCEARGPLVRNSNIHIYNCYYEGQSDYAMNPRANAYIFSEYNMFERAKNPMRVDSGAIKSYNDSFTTCYGRQDGTIVADKSQPVSTSCRYANFDTNRDLSYIPTGDYLLDEDVLVAKRTIAAYAGPMKTIENIKTPEDANISIVLPERVEGLAKLDFSASTTISLPLNSTTVKKGTNVDVQNIRFNVAGTDSGYVKLGGNAQGQDIVFWTDCPVHIAVTAGTGAAPALVSGSGETLLVGSGLVKNVGPGTFIIQSSVFEKTYKNAYITKLEIEKAGASDPSIQEPEAAAPGTSGGDTDTDKDPDDTGGGSGSTTPGSGSGSGSAGPVDGSYVHNFTEQGKTSQFYDITGNLSSSKGTVHYGDLTLTQCLKMESSTSIKFTAGESGTLTLVFVETSPSFKLDGANISGSSQAITVTVTAGAHEIKKLNGDNLFYMFYTPDSAVQAHEHSWSDWGPDLEDESTWATCTEPGVELRECTECGETEIRDADPLGHDYDAEGVCTRCGDVKEPDDPDAPKPVNKSALTAAIGNAEMLAESVAEDTDADNVPEGSLWALAADIEAFEDAIAAAQAVADDPDATQDEVDAAVTALAAAVEEFMGKCEEGTKEPDPPPAATTHVLDANTMEFGDHSNGNDTTVADYFTIKWGDKGKVADTTSSTFEDDYEGLQYIHMGGASQTKNNQVTRVINFTTTSPNSTVKIWYRTGKAGTNDDGSPKPAEARDVAVFKAGDLKTIFARSNNTADDEDTAFIDNFTLENPGDYSVGILGNTCFIYKIEVTEPPIASETPETADKDDLNEAIEAAEVNLESASVSDDGKDVDPDDEWVTEADQSAYRIAIATAKAVARNANATQAQVDAALAALEAATEKFDAAKQAGAKGNDDDDNKGNEGGDNKDDDDQPGDPADKDALESAVSAAKNVANAAIVSVDGSDVATTSKWVTEAEKKAFTDAIAAAEAVLKNANATQDEVDDAIEALANAKTTFDAAKKPGTKTSGSTGGGNGGGGGSTGGGAAGGGTSGGASSGTSTTTTTSPDGTKTTTTTQTDGTKTETVTKPDGSVTETVTKTDGTKTETVTETDGTKTETVTRPDGAKTETVTKTDGTVTERKTRTDGARTEKVREPDGDVTITATRPDGEVVAKVEIPAAPPALENKFSDVPTGHWAESAINNMAALGVINGTSTEERVFETDSDITRGAMAQILFNLSQGKSGLDENFEDVAEGEWYTNAVAWAADAGIVNGYSDGNFGPNDAITREQLAVMLYRYANLLGLDTGAEGDMTRFADNSSVSSWASQAMAWAVSRGIINGKGNGILDPTASATRAETAVMFNRFLALL